VLRVRAVSVVVGGQVVGRGLRGWRLVRCSEERACRRALAFNLVGGWKDGIWPEVLGLLMRVWPGVFPLGSGGVEGRWPGVPLHLEMRGVCAW